MCRSWSRKTFGVRGPGTALVFKELETIGKFPVDADVFETQSGAGSPHSKKRHAPSGIERVPDDYLSISTERIDRSFLRAFGFPFAFLRTFSVRLRLSLDGV